MPASDLSQHHKVPVPESSTLNSCSGASLPPASQSYRAPPFEPGTLLAFLCLPLCSLALVILSWFSSPTPPCSLFSRPSSFFSLCSIYCFLFLFWSLPDTSGCTLPRIYNRTLALHGPLELSHPPVRQAGLYQTDLHDEFA